MNKPDVFSKYYYRITVHRKVKKHRAYISYQKGDHILREFCFDDGCARLDSPHSAVRFALAFGSCLSKGDRVILSCSGRKDAELYVSLISQALFGIGINIFVLSHGEEFLSAFCANTLSARCYIHVYSGACVRVCASGKNGEQLSDRLLSEVTRRFKSEDFRNVDAGKLGETKNADEITNLYKELIKQGMTSFDGLTVSVKTSSSFVAELFDEIIRDKNDVYGDKTVFSFSLDCKKLSAYSSSSGYVYHETLMMLALKYLLDRGARIKVPERFSYIKDRLPDGVTVIDENERQEISFENRFLTDSFLLMTLVIRYLCEGKKSLGEAVSEIPPVFFTERYVYTGVGADKRLDRMIASGFLDIKGRRTLENGRTRAKLSKEGRGIMLYADSHSFEAASAICDEIERYIGRINLDKEE